MLDDVDLSLKLSKSQGLKQLQAAQHRLLALRLQLGGLIGEKRLGPPVCALFEGWDASGKGGAIRRLTAPLDPRHIRVAQFAAPSEREARHHFLWRFWPALPGWGGMAVLDRSWYGRVLVERVEGFAAESEWRRAYEEIVNFEAGICSEGMVLIKFWLHLSEEEQLRRFLQRERDPLKQWKLTDEDWRNRSNRPAYEQALAEMLERTDHEQAPWRLIAADNKPYARVAVLNAVVEAIEQGLRDAGQEPLDVEAAL
jgi:AMP-polyphosphate phosphotransferase